MSKFYDWKQVVRATPVDSGISHSLAERDPKLL